MSQLNKLGEKGEKEERHGERYRGSELRLSRPSIRRSIGGIFVYDKVCVWYFDGKKDIFFLIIYNYN